MNCTVVITERQARESRSTPERYLIDRFANDYGVAINGMSDARLEYEALTRGDVLDAVAFRITFDGRVPTCADMRGSFRHAGEGDNLCGRCGQPRRDHL